MSQSANQTCLTSSVSVRSDEEHPVLPETRISTNNDCQRPVTAPERTSCVTDGNTLPRGKHSTSERVYVLLVKRDFRNSLVHQIMCMKHKNALVCLQDNYGA